MRAEVYRVPTDAREHAFHDHARNLELIGSGLYGQVYGSNDTPYVVKIMRAHDYGYRAWAEVAQAFADSNPYMPRILQVAHYIADDSGPHYEKGRAPSDCMVFYIESLEKSPGHIRNSYNSGFRRFLRRLSEILWSLRYNDTDHRGIRHRLENFRPIHRDLLAGLLLALESTKNGVFDLHAGNALKRGKQMVIIDPIC